MSGRVQRTLLLSALVLVAMPVVPAEAGGGCRSEGPELADAVVGTDVELRMNCFRPAVLSVGEGATVRFTNYDEVEHVVVGTQWGISGEIPSGGTAEHQFLRRGAYPYSCYLHPGMNGVVLVGDQAPAGPAQLAASATPPGNTDFAPLALAGFAGLTAGAAASLLRRRLQR